MAVEDTSSLVNVLANLAPKTIVFDVAAVRLQFSSCDQRNWNEEAM